MERHDRGVSTLLLSRLCKQDCAFLGQPVRRCLRGDRIRDALRPILAEGVLLPWDYDIRPPGSDAGTGRLLEDISILRRELERLGQLPDGQGPGASLHSPLEIPYPTDAEVRPLRQLLLSQPQGSAIPSEEYPECGEFICCHLSVPPQPREEATTPDHRVPLPALSVTIETHCAGMCRFAPGSYTHRVAE
jgi:hypothetical protein